MNIQLANPKISTDLRELEKSLFDECYFVPREIVGRDDKTSKVYATGSSRRHSHTVKEIIQYVNQRGTSTIQILNASGIQSGHQDFSICNFLRQYYDVQWTVFESPDNPYLDMPAFKDKLSELKIDCQLADFSKEAQLYGEEFYDVILFTEIAEHLDHSTFLKALAAIKARLKEDGILILTTPNLSAIGNRIKLLFGYDDLGYWGDDLNYLEKKTYWGHITLYGLRRLCRLLEGIGFKIEKNYTFNCERSISGVKDKMLFYLSQVVSRSKGTLCIVAKNGPSHL